MGLAAILAFILLRYEKPKAQQQTLRQGLQRVDFLGALTLAFAVSSDTCQTCLLLNQF